MYSFSFVMIVLGTLFVYFTGGFVFLIGIYLMGKGIFNLFKKLG